MLGACAKELLAVSAKMQQPHNMYLVIRLIAFMGYCTDKVRLEPVVTDTLLKLAEWAPFCEVCPVSEKLCVPEPTAFTEIVVYVPCGTCITVVPDDGKLYGVAIPLKVAW